MNKRQFVENYVLSAAMGTSGNGNWSRVEPRTIVETAIKTWKAMQELAPEEVKGYQQG